MSEEEKKDYKIVETNVDVLINQLFSFKESEISRFCDDEKVGSVTSGSQSPSLQKGIGLAYLNINKANIDSELDILVRNKTLKCRVVKPPFYKNGSVLD